MQEEVRRPLSWWSWSWSCSVGRERRRPGVQEEIRILLRQSEVVHLLGVDQLGQALSWCYWEELQQCLGSLDQFGGGVQSLGLVDHSDELMRRRLGGINVKPCLSDVGKGLWGE